jgi:hypothetical protein
MKIEVHTTQLIKLSLGAISKTTHASGCPCIATIHIELIKVLARSLAAASGPTDIAW